jgi:3-phenylpropionate/cinnamic acid dioxygenase small subunit
MTAAELRDREQIRELLGRYARALDTRNWEALARCFTTNARAEFSGVALESGVDYIVRHLRQLESLVASSHLVGNVVIEFDPDGAIVESQAVVHLVLNEGPPARLRVRGVFYRDRVVRDGHGWRIKERHHRAGWSIELGAV